MTLHGYVVGYGNVEPAPANGDQPAADARISVDWPAIVSEVRCVEGQHVDKGQVLFVAKPATFFSAAVPNTGEAISPISGTVVFLDVHAGETALPTKMAVEVVDLDRLVVAAGIPAWQASAISVGEAASVEIPADPARGQQVKFDSKVERVERAVDPKTNLASVDIAVPPKQVEKSGEFA